MVALLELVWGDGFMAPGGKGNIENMVKGMDLRDKLVLDVGSGIGGPAMVLVEDFGARVIGIDLEAPLVERAQAKAAEKGLSHRIEFMAVEKGSLPFDDRSFDFVLSTGAFTHTEDKFGIFRECYRVLKPRGVLSCYDWMRTPREYSDDMRYWFKVEGLSYAMETLERHGDLLEAAGFEDIELRDASDWYRKEVAWEYEHLKGAFYPRICAAIGKDQADHFVENWRAMVVVCESGEMRQGYYRGRRSV